MMLRITLPRMACVCALVGWMGCQNLVETKAINSFMTAVHQQDYEQLRSATSPDFAQRALRTTEALDDFKILNLPKGETTVVEVQESSDTEKLVTVQAGKLKKKLFYRLVKNEGSDEWVVDDVYVRQRKGGVKVDKSIAEQMDLLLNVREFLTVWHDGSREEVLSVTTPELSAVLKELPPIHLSRLCQSVVSEHIKDDRLRPRAQLDNDVAVVTLPRKTGKMIVSFKLLEGQWLVSDVAVESKHDQEHIASVLKTATAIRATSKFLSAYNRADKQELETLCHPKFYQSSLLPGDLTTVSLPDEFISKGRYHVKMEGTQADFIIQESDRVVKIGLARVTDIDPLDRKTIYRIEDVTIYPNPVAGKDLQEMRLSMVFTGRAVMELFRESLTNGELSLLKKTATQDFNSRVWNRIDDEAVAEFTPGLLTNSVEQTLHTEYDGAICKMTVEQMGLPVTYVLRDRKGQVAVDDVIIGANDDSVASRDITSMKETMELMIPLRDFREALAKSDLDQLQRISSADMTQMIWKQADDVPSAGKIAVKHLLAPLKSMQKMEEGKTLVTLGNASFGCSVLMVTEHDQPVIDDIVLIAGVQPELRARLKSKMRDQLSIGGPDSELPNRKPEILHAGNWQEEAVTPETTKPLQSQNTIQQADFEDFPPLPETQIEAPLPPKSEQPAMQFFPQTDTEPLPEYLPQGNASPEGKTAPPLFPGGEAELEQFVPDIKPSDTAFDSPVSGF